MSVDNESKTDNIGFFYNYTVYSKEFTWTHKLNDQYDLSTSLSQPGALVFILYNDTDRYTPILHKSCHS